MKNRLSSIGMMLCVVSGCFFFQKSAVALPPINYCHKFRNKENYLDGYYAGVKIDLMLHTDHAQSEKIIAGFRLASQHRSLNLSQAQLLDKTQFTKVTSKDFVIPSNHEAWYAIGYNLYSYIVKYDPEEYSANKANVKHFTNGLVAALNNVKTTGDFDRTFEVYINFLRASAISNDRQLYYALGYLDGRYLHLPYLIKKGIIIDDFLSGFSDASSNKKLSAMLSLKSWYYKSFVSSAEFKKASLGKRKTYSYFDGYSYAKPLYRYARISSRDKPFFREGFSDGTHQIRLNKKTALLVHLVDCR